MFTMRCALSLHSLEQNINPLLLIFCFERFLYMGVLQKEQVRLGSGLSFAPLNFAEHDNVQNLALPLLCSLSDASNSLLQCKQVFVMNFNGESFFACI